MKTSRALSVLTMIAALWAATGTPAIALTASPSRSPWIVYGSDLRGDTFGPEGIFLVHPDGSDDHEIAVDAPGEHLHPSWAPNGRSIVFSVDTGAYRQLYLTDAAGRHGRQLTDCTADCLGYDDAAIARDNRTVATVRYDGPLVTTGSATTPARWALQVATIGDHGITHVRTLLRTNSVTAIDGPRWSPDGTSLVFWQDHVDPSTGAEDRTAIFTIRADGTGLRQLTPWSMLAGEVDWSPDGKWLVFDTHPLVVFNFDQVVSNLYTVRPDGSGLTQLTHADTPAIRSTQPRWTSNGQILYTQVTPAARTIWPTSTRCETSHPVAPGSRRIRTHADWQPTPS